MNRTVRRALWSATLLVSIGSGIHAQDAPPAKKPVVEQIYDQLKSLFQGTSEQLFCMEFPGRVLDPATYTYEVDSVYSQITKPQPVVEAEFRLSDGLLDVAQIVGGPSGASMADTYKRALDLLIPKAASSAFDDDQDSIREWLGETVPGEKDPAGNDMTRMALFRKLSDDYLTARDAWKNERASRINQARAAQNPDEALDAVARQMAIEGPAREAQIAALYDDLVVRGDYHKVKAALGYLDIELEAGALEDAKDRLRDAEMLALDESRSVFPVQFQPADWFQALRTDFQPTDLLMDPALIRDRIISKQKQLERLNAQMSSLLAGETGDVAGLNKQVAAAQQALSAAQATQVKNFSKATLTIAEWAINKYYTGSTSPAQPAGQEAPPASAAEEEKKKAAAKGAPATQGPATKKSGLAASEELAKDGVLTEVNKEIQKQAAGPPLSPEQWKQLLSFQDAAIDAQTALTNASTQLTDRMSDLAEAEASDTKKTRILIQGQINVLRKEIEELEDSLRAGTVQLANANGKEVLASPPALVPEGEPKAGRWMDVIVESSRSQAESSSTLSTHTSNTSWQIDTIFGSAGGSSSVNDGASSFENDSDDYDIKIGMRATKVTINRGWFAPDIFRRSSSFWKLAPDDPNNPDGISISHGVPTGKADDPADVGKLNDALFPAYPIAFIIVKDVTIQIKSDSAKSSQMKSFADARSAVGGGILCFSASNSSASRSSSSSSYTGQTEDTVIIRIPGPQILGWFLEYVPEDKSVPFSKADGVGSDVTKMFRTRAAPVPAADAKPVDDEQDVR